VAGGNLSRSPGPLVIDVTVVGTVKRRQALTRGGARVGDEIYVSGTIGAAAAGLQLLKRAATEDTDNNGTHRVMNEPCPPSSSVTSVVGPCVQRYLRPDPRVRLGVLIGRNRAASACVDLSDGLADGLHQIAEASSVGITLDGDAVPIESTARRILGDKGEDTLLAAITGGDDYELLVAVRPRTRRRLIAAAQRAGVTLTRIGRCTEDRAVTLHRPEGDMPLPGGYSHFGRP
jgi:thiamine-monophosphate kinase